MSKYNFDIENIIRADAFDITTPNPDFREEFDDVCVVFRMVKGEKLYYFLADVDQCVKLNDAIGHLIEKKLLEVKELDE